MSTISRTLRYLRRIGFGQYAYQMNRIGDTKYGVLVGTDKYGNKYYENNDEELPLRTKWVDYKEWKEYDASMVEPGWHGWLAYMFDKPPTSEAIMKHDVRPWENKEHIPNQTFSRAAYKPYSTTKSKISSWDAIARPRV
ncbi:NADH ubiquinone oxidoreductase subunit NDUFA12-domain-containing protein [Morchella snyderi]|nr:NADH ubiquinone oxidoreductase subunit NDUFA12-domain-containing protein [Morchella snyderi]